MKKRIEGEETAPEFNIAAVEDVEAHIYSLRDLGEVVSRAMSSMMAFELRIRFSLSELENALLQAHCTDVHRTRELLTPLEAARRLRVDVSDLAKGTGKNFPKPIISGRRCMYRTADVNDWLLNRHQGDSTGL